MQAIIATEKIKSDAFIVLVFLIINSFTKPKTMSCNSLGHPHCIFVNNINPIAPSFWFMSQRGLVDNFDLIPGKFRKLF
jgi:hypothetical protein